MVEFLQPTDEALRWLGDNLRREDAVEIGLSNPGMTPYEVLAESVRVSAFARVAVDPKTATPLVAFGVQRADNLLNGIGCIWLLGTGRAGVVRFARWTRRMLPAMFLPGIEVLTNVVWVEYRDCIKWLEWLGARFEPDPCPDAPNFVRFCIYPPGSSWVHGG